MGAFSCNILAYRVQTSTATGPSSLESINRVTGEMKIIKSNLGIQVNAIGYNPLDNYIYGVWDDGTLYHIVRIGDLGEVTDMGAILSSATPGLNMGDIDSNGYFYIKRASQSSYYTIDLRPGSTNYMGFVNPQAGYIPAVSGFSSSITPSGIQTQGDWTFNIIDGHLYCADNINTTLLRINPTTGVLTTLTVTPSGLPLNYGGIFSDANGFIYGIDNASGRIIRWQNTSGTTMSGVPFSQSTPSSRTDAAACIFFNTLLDFGDCPDTSSANASGNYSSLIENNGPRHAIDNNLLLGSGITAENNAKQNPTATGDEDDSVSTPIFIFRGSPAVDIPINYTNNTGQNATIYAWIDFNNNGIFELNEFTSIVVPSSTSNPRTATLSIPVPSTFNLTNGTNTFARFRITTDGLSNSNGGLTQEDTRSLGPASNGEVEDYIVTVSTLSISGVIWQELDCNGLFQTPEVGKSGVTVELYRVDNPTTPYRIDTTDSSGNYLFNELPPGKYYIKVILPENSNFTLPNVASTVFTNSNINPSSGQSNIINLNSNNTSTNISAGLCKCITVSGKAFFDCNSNGIYDNSEAILPGVELVIFNSNNIQVGYTKTDCNGYYEFTCLGSGTYSLLFIPPNGLTITTQQSTQYYGSKPSPTNGTVTVSLLTNTDATNVFVGFTGDTGLYMRYCTSCSSCSSCSSSFNNNLGCNSKSSCNSKPSCNCSSDDKCGKCKDNLCTGSCNRYLC